MRYKFTLDNQLIVSFIRSWWMGLEQKQLPIQDSVEALDTGGNIPFDLLNDDNVKRIVIELYQLEEGTWNSSNQTEARAIKFSKTEFIAEEYSLKIKFIAI